MTYYQVIYSDELYHHGIKGQKWGNRRYQNEDGSLTDAGRARYGVLGRIGMGVSKVSNAIHQHGRNKNYRKAKVWRTDSKQGTSSNRLLGRRINASYDVRRERGQKLANAGRTRVGAIGRGIARSFGRQVGLAALNSAGALAVGMIAKGDTTSSTFNTGMTIVNGMINAANVYGGVSNAVRTYQDVADITTYMDSVDRKKRR